MSSIYTFAKNGQLSELSNALSENSELVLSRNNLQQTPLAAAIIGSSEMNPPADQTAENSHANKKKSISATVEVFLKAGASNSVFVKGHALNSLICTLPFAVQTPSSAFNHSPPLPLIDSEDVVTKVDLALCDYLQRLGAKKVSPMAASAAIVTPVPTTPPAPFDFFPKDLKVLCVMYLLYNSLCDICGLNFFLLNI